METAEQRILAATMHGQMDVLETLKLFLDSRPWPFITKKRLVQWIASNAIMIRLATDAALKR